MDSTQMQEGQRILKELYNVWMQEGSIEKVKKLVSPKISFVLHATTELVPFGKF